MAKEQTEGRLKLIHLIYLLLTAALGIGLVVGGMLNQQEVNTSSIEAKVGKEVFIQHEVQQRESLERIYSGIDRIEKKLDK